MKSLCSKKDMFGKPGEGAHSYRFMGIAIVDFLLTVIVALLVAWIMKWSIGWTLLGFFILGIIAHRLFCVRTTVDKLLFP